MGCGSAGRRAQDVCGCRHVKGRAWRFRIPLATLEGHGILIRGGLLRRRELGAAVTSRKRVNARAPVASLPKGRRGRHYIQWMGSANAGLPYHGGEEAQQGEHAAHWGVSLVVPGAGGRGGGGVTIMPSIGVSAAGSRPSPWGGLGSPRAVATSAALPIKVRACSCGCPEASWSMLPSALGKRPGARGPNTSLGSWSMPSGPDWPGGVCCLFLLPN